MPPGADSDVFRDRVDGAVEILFAHVSESLGWATHALLDQDFEGAHRVIAGDHRIDELCDELTSLVRERLSEVSLDSDELENLVAILQIVPELERSGDLAKHIAQRSQKGLGGVISARSRGIIQSMGEIAIEMWKVAGESYVRRSRDARFQLDEADQDLDELAARLVSEGVEQGADSQVAVDLALIARFYERLGDHAVNLSRRVDEMAAPRRTSGVTQAKRRQSPAGGLPGSKDGLAHRLIFRLKHLRLVPADEGFFELFRAAAGNARECAAELSKLTASFSDLDEHFDEIKQFERKGDQITSDLLRRLDTSFVTPYDREDIHALAEELDDVVDDMFSAASLIQLVQVEQPLPEVAELSEVLVNMADEMVTLVGCLPQREGTRLHLERIEHLEREGDVIFRRAIARLFSGEYEAIEILKWKDIVQAIENSLNAVEDVSDVVESILVKNS